MTNNTMTDNYLMPRSPLQEREDELNKQFSLPLPFGLDQGVPPFGQPQQGALPLTQPAGGMAHNVPPVGSGLVEEPSFLDRVGTSDYWQERFQNPLFLMGLNILANPEQGKGMQAGLSSIQQLQKMQAARGTGGVKAGATRDVPTMVAGQPSIQKQQWDGSKWVPLGVDYPRYAPKEETVQATGLPGVMLNRATGKYTDASGNPLSPKNIQDMVAAKAEAGATQIDMGDGEGISGRDIPEGALPLALKAKDRLQAKADLGIAKTAIRDLSRMKELYGKLSKEGVIGQSEYLIGEKFDVWKEEQRKNPDVITFNAIRTRITNTLVDMQKGVAAKDDVQRKMDELADLTQPSAAFYDIINSAIENAESNKELNAQVEQGWYYPDSYKPKPKAKRGRTRARTEKESFLDKWKD